MTPDLAARRVIMAAYLYYERNSPIISDESFDKLCDYVANNWGFLEPIRQFQLTSPEAIRASGFHICVTMCGESAALLAHQRKFKQQPHGIDISADRWRFDENWRCHFATLGG